MTAIQGRSALTRAAVLAAVLPLAGGVLVAAAPAASADVTAPGAGTKYTRYAPVRISATYDGALSGTERLFLEAPGCAEREVHSESTSTSGGTLDFAFDLNASGADCHASSLAPNGTWTVRQSGSTAHESTFITAIAPNAPADVAASAVNSREVRISWRKGQEPDLRGWAVLEGGQQVANVGLGACEGTTCSAVVGYAAEGSGDHTYVVQAFRATAPGSSGTIESTPSAPASARLDAPPPPPSEEPAPADGGTSGESSGGETSGGETSGGETSGGTSGGESSGGQTSGGGSSGSETSGSTGGGQTSGGGTTTGGGTTAGSGGSTGGSAIGTGTTSSSQTADQKAVAQRKAFALGFSAFGPKLGIPKLPPLPQAQAPAIAPELPDGTFEPTLGFEDQVLTERVPVAQGTPTERVRNVVGSALDSERLVRSTAGALVLLLLGAHLRRWLGSAAEDH